MVSCYDCEHFGIGCLGIVPPIKYRDTIADYCPRFRVVPWRKELYKPIGCARLSHAVD